MTGAGIASVTLAAVLVFWMVGAHNRLVALRNAIIAAFPPVDEKFRQRHLLLRKQAQSLATAEGDAAAALEALHAALSQAEAACLHARAHPGAVGAVTSLRVAEDVLAATRARLPAPPGDDPAAAEIGARVAASEVTLDFTRQQFNQAVAAYNAAVRQFPTWLVAALFGFRPAATL